MFRSSGWLATTFLRSSSNEHLASSVLMPALLILFSGCAHQLEFRVTDAPSGEPLPGATVSVRRVTSFTYFQRRQKQHDLGPTDANGAITTPRIDAHDDIHFQAPRYYGAVSAL